MTESAMVSLVGSILTFLGAVVTCVASVRKASRDADQRLEKSQMEADHRLEKSQMQAQARQDQAMAIVTTKVEELTREVHEHNNFARRMPVVEEQIKVINHRLQDLEDI